MTIEYELAAIETQMVSDAETVTHPIFIHMLGIPGSGKSSFLKILQNEWQKKATVSLLGFDQIMQNIPSYQAMGDKIAGFVQYEIPARLSGYRILESLLLKRAHILFDNGGSAESHPDLLRHARDELGYQLVFVSIETPVEVARARVDLRAVEAGQHTPLHYLEERYAKLQRLIPQYQALAHRFYTIENNGTDMAAFIQNAQDTALGICELLDY